MCNYFMQEMQFWGKKIYIKTNTLLKTKIGNKFSLIIYLESEIFKIKRSRLGKIYSNIYLILNIAAKLRCDTYHILALTYFNCFSAS